MAHVSAERMADFSAVRRHGIRSGRHIALLGGTTTLSDFMLAARHLANPSHLVYGPSIAAYESTFAQMIGVRHAYTFCSGRVGLYGLLRALRIEDGDEVLLQAPTHIVVANAIRYAGARPVYVDCLLDNYNMDIGQAERRVTRRTKVLILQHTFGIPVDLDAALQLAWRYGLAVIEDCVHALGTTYDGRQVGSFGQAAFFSTEETKTISSTMGGMVVTNDSVLADRVRAFQDTCICPSILTTAHCVLKFALYYLLMDPHMHRFARMVYEVIGRRHPLPRPTTPDELRGMRPPRYERCLSNAQAAIALQQLRRLKSNLAHRRAVAEAYAARLADFGVAPPRVPAGAQPAYVRYPVRVKNRDEALRQAAPHALLGTWFTSVLEEAVTPACGGYEAGSCPQAEEAAVHLVNLPTHPRVTLQDVDHIVEALGPIAYTSKAG